MRFVDTNVLLYSIDTSAEAKHKYLRSRRLLQEKDLALSVQVLQEFYTQATRISRPNAIPHAEAAAHIHALCRYRVQEMTVPLLNAALVTRQRYKISYWDAAIVEAARTLGCITLLTEDLNHGQDFGGVRIVNPFLEQS